MTSNIQTQFDAKGTGTVSSLSDLSVTSTAAELNILDGVTSTAAELNILDGVTATAAELNVLDGALKENNSIWVGNDPSSTTNSALKSIAIGTTALDAITTGDYNTAIGYDALTNQSTGNNNVAVGYEALRDNSTTSNNVAIGLSALQESNASGNVAIGANAMRGSTGTPITGGENVAIGSSSLKFNIGGTANAAFGKGSLGSNTEGDYNSAIGKGSLNDNTEGSNNTALGYLSGNTGTNDITTGNQNTLLGASTAVSSATATNQIVIGYGAIGKGDNTVTIGNGDITAWSASDDNEVDLGSSSVEFKDLYIDGTANLDAVDIDGGAIDGAAIGANSASTGAFTTITASNSVTANANLTVGNGATSGGSIILKEDSDDGTNTLTLKPAAMSSDVSFILPADDGSANQVLKTDGSGVLSWTTPSSVTVTVSDNENTNEANALIFAADADIDGGTLGLESDGDATYNPSTGTITATNFNGNLTGTLQTAAQGNITSLGTLSALTVDNVITDGTTIGHTDDTDLITLANGSVSFTGSTVISTADVNGGAIDGAAIGASSASTGAFTTITASTSLDVTGSTGIILENDETITNSTDGTVLINGTVAGGTGSAAGVFTSNGDNDVILQTGNSTTGSITITDGANGNIAITPNGSGAVQLDGLSWPTADGSANQVLKTDGSGSLSFASVATSVNGLSDALIEDNSLYLGQDPSSTTSTAQRNISIGTTALDAITTGDDNTAIGYDALTNNTTGHDNVAIGYNVLKSNVGGAGNSAMGSGSLTSNTGGDYNTAIGNNSLKENIGGGNNVAIGNSSLRDNTSGNNNTSVGKSSSQLITTGDNNVTLGYLAGNVLTTGGNNVIIGSDSDPSANSGSNQIVIGYGAIGKGDNTVTIGNGDITAWSASDDNEVDLGSSSVEFKDLYIDGTANLDAVDIDGGAIDGAAIGANSASTGSFTTLTASTSLDVTGSTGIILENDETITNSSDGTVLITATTTSLSGDLTVTGNDLVFGNAETISNSVDGTVAITATTTSLSGDLTVTGNDLVFGNAETISNSVDGTVAITATTTSLSGDLTVTGNDIAFGNGETLSNATDGTMHSNATTLLIGNGSVDPTIKSNGNKDLTLQTGATNTGSIVLRDGSNNDIELTPHGTGEVLIGGSYTIKSNGDNDITIKTGNSTTGSISITDGANGDIAVAPNGTGETTFGGNPISNFSASTVTITGATTLAASHNGKVLICNSSSNFSLTVPEDTLPAGFNVMIVQKGAGEVTLAAASGNVTINNRNSHTKTANQWAIMSLICIDATTDANVFVSGGDGAS